MPSLNQVTKKCIWQNYGYYIMITLLPNKVKKYVQNIEIKKIVFFLKNSHVPF
jgi:hypothetical protein